MTLSTRAGGAVALLAGLVCIAARPAAADVALVPKPMVATAGAGSITVPQGAVIAVPRNDRAAAFDARWLSAAVRRDRGLFLAPRSAPATAALIVFTRLAAEARLGPEGYRLKVSPDGVRVEAATDAGLFYGAASLLQLLTPEDGRRGPVSVDAVTIEDRPRFAWRGLMLDSARHFQSVAFIERLLDQMARYKLNIFHWHLTDDQAWRLQIRRYPRLTALSGCGRASERVAVDPGCYTASDVRKVVAFAAARGVTVVPEIETPGHASAAILAYPALGVRPVDPKSLADWGVFPNLYNPNAATLDFLRNVLDEVTALFPGPYVHVGGDEAIKPYWRGSPAVQARIRALGLKDEDALQGWFIKEIEADLARRGKRLVGWDEVLQDGLPKGAVVMSWHGVSRGLEAVKAGHDAVLTPTAPLYFDFRQSDAANEPPGRGEVNDLKAVYAFEPALPPDPTPGRVLGVQANLWTEHVRREAWAEAMAFPRAAALAEVAWTPPAARRWDDFTARLAVAIRRDQAAGLRPALSAFTVRVSPTYDDAGDAARVRLNAEAGDVEIRYTLDGAPPTLASARYGEDLTLRLPAHMRAAAFEASGRRIGPITDVRLDRLTRDTRDNHALTLCRSGQSLNLEEDPSIPPGARPVGMVDLFNPCWTWPKAPLAGHGGLRAEVGATRMKFAFGGTFDLPRPPAPQTPAGELEARLDTCKGPVVARLPLPADAERRRRAVLRGPFIASAVPTDGAPHDLCFIFNRAGPDPLWIINRATLEAGRAP